MTDMTIDVNERATVVGNLAEFPLGALKLVKVDGRRLCVVHTSTGIHALDNACPHEGYGLTPVTSTVSCSPARGTTGSSVSTTASCVLGEEDVRTHAVEVADDGTISIALVEPDADESRPRCWPACGAGWRTTTSARCRATSCGCCAPTPTPAS